MKLRSLVTALVLTFPAPALAAGFYCEGNVHSIGVSSGTGRFWVRYGAIGMQQICAVADTNNGVQPDTCRAWLAVLSAAKAQDKTVRIYYDSATAGNPSSCSGFQAWTSYVAYFVETVD